LKGSPNNNNEYNQQRKGGPSTIPGSTAAEDVLVGVNSWGIGCATKVFPGDNDCL
jgi:hypothetical protein